MTGCATAPHPDPIPQYPPADAEAILTTVRARLTGLHAVRGQATIDLTDANGQTVRLDAAYLLRPPDRARLRAWKFGQAVFDLTVRDGQAWAFVPRDEAKPAVPGTRQALTRWLGLIGGSADLLRGTTALKGGDGGVLTVSRPVEDGLTLYCTIYGHDRTIRAYKLVDAHGVQRFSLTLADYRPAGGGQVWPNTITAVGPTGTFVIHSHDVDVNGDLPASAFTPPARAEALP